MPMAAQFFPVRSDNLPVCVRVWPLFVVSGASLYIYRVYLPVLVLRQVRELASSRDLEGVLDMPRRDGTRIRM